MVKIEKDYNGKPLDWNERYKELTYIQELSGSARSEYREGE